MGRRPDVNNYGMRKSREAHGLNFQKKSNFDAARHEERMALIREARLAEKAEMQASVEANQAPQKERSPFKLRFPTIAEAPFFNYEPGEFGPEDPRGIQALVKTFYDDAAAAREAVYAYYQQHKGTELTAEMVAEYDSLYENAEYALEKVAAIRKIIDLVSSAFTREFVAAQSAEAKQRIYDALTGIDPKEVAALIAQDFRSIGGVIKKLYNLRNVDRRQFAMAVKVVGVLLFGTIVPLSQAACSVATEPGVTPTTTETTGTEEGVTEEAPTEPAPTEPAPTEPAPTDPAPEETPTAEANMTREAIGRMAGYDEYLAQFTNPNERAAVEQAIEDWLVQLNFGAWGSPESFRVVSATEIEVIGDFPDGSTYQMGDHIIKTEEAPYNITYNKLAYDPSSPLADADGTAHLDDSYTFSMAGGLPMWTSSNPDEEAYPDYLWVEWYEGGEFITSTFMAEQHELMQQEADLAEAQAFAAANGLAPVDHLEYDDGLNSHTTAFDAQGNPVAEKENEELGWVEIIPTQESIFMSENFEGTNMLQGLTEWPAGTQVVIHNSVERWWAVTGMNSEELSKVNPNNIPFLSPDRIYEDTHPVVNGLLTTAVLSEGEEFGSNKVVNEVTGVYVLDTFEYKHPTKDSIYKGLVVYWPSLDNKGNLIIVVDYLFTSVLNPTSDTYIDYAQGFAPDGSVTYDRKNFFPYYPQIDAMIEAAKLDPNNQHAIYIGEKRRESYLSGDGPLYAAQDAAAVGTGGYPLDDIRNMRIDLFSGTIAPQMIIVPPATE